VDFPPPPRKPELGSEALVDVDCAAVDVGVGDTLVEERDIELVEELIEELEVELDVDELETVIV